MRAASDGTRSGSQMGRAAGPLDRRRLLGLIAAGTGLLVRPPLASSAEALPVDRTFDVYRKGSKIGEHHITFVARNGGFVAQTDINLVVKVAFITVYHYRQIGHDVWRGGVLVGSDVTTDDDGKKTALTLDEANGRLTGDGANGALDLKLGTMTDLSWWNSRIVGVDKLLDAQLGVLSNLTIQNGVSEQIEVKGAWVDATRYRMASSKGREGDIWYANGLWVKAHVTTRGQTLDYQLVS